MIDFIDKTTDVDGTPLNRANMMALQDFEARTITYNSNGSITETNSSGHTLTTTFVDFKTIKETFIGDKTIVRTITFSENGYKEVLS